MASVKVGLIGTGNIAPAYVRGCRQYPILDLVACTDLDAERAAAFAAEHNLQSMPLEDMLAHPDIDILINLTVPKVHAEVSLRILEAGKHVYSEKPLAIERADAARVIALAEEKGLRVGCAPDTFLGGGQQTCRKIIDDGWIGQPINATAFMGGHGPESWHPNPFFFYQRGGGPLLDMGPYYVTALVNLIGGVTRVAAMSRASFAERTAGHESLRGQRFPVEVNTHVNGLLQFESGAIANLVMSFDVWKHDHPRIEIYGTEGTLSVPDPNTFGGTPRVWNYNDREWRELPLVYDASIGRGTGVADMAYAIKHNRAHRASGALAYHALDVMLSLEEASEQGAYLDIQSRVDQPAALPMGPLPDALDHT